MSIGPLDGVRVLDHGHVWAGPLVGLMFAEMGADVIKVQSPSRRSGVDMGGVSAAAALGGSEHAASDDPLAYHGLERNKRSVTIELTQPEGLALYRRLVAVSDVIVENFSPRVMPGLGLGYDALREVNPRIIVAALSAAGATPGPWRDLVTYGPSLGALYGLKSVQGYQDDPHPREDRADLDPTAAAHAFFAILAALEFRDRTGAGQFLDVAQGECALQRLAEPLLDYEFNGRVAGPQGNRYGGLAPHGVYRAAGEDEWIAIVVRDEAEWRALLSVAGEQAPRLHEARFAELAGRLRDQDALDEAIEAWTARHEPMALTTALQEAGVAAFPAMGPPDLVADANFEQLGRTGWLMEADEAVTIDQIYQGVVWKLSKTPGGIQRPSPRLGQHNRAVFGGLLGLSEAEIESLERAEVI